jgi:YVTN family beta-propeller protein
MALPLAIESHEVQLCGHSNIQAAVILLKENGMRAINRVGVFFNHAATVPGSRGLWLLAAVGIAFATIALTPATDPTSSMPGFGSVSAAAPSPYSDSKLATEALDSIKATATTGTPAAGGPSANIGQTIQLKGAGIQAGNASFAGYNGTPVTSPLTSVKPGKKAKTVVPQLAVTGPVMAIPAEGDPTNTLNLQIVPTISPLSPNTITVGSQITINGTGFAPDAKVRFPGVANPATPDDFDQDSAAVTVPAGVQKGKLTIVTSGGTSNTIKIKVAAALANKVLASDTVTGMILVADDTANTLSALDPQTGHVVRSIAVVDEPTRIVVSANPHRATVLNDEGRFTTINLDTWTAGSARKGGLPVLVLEQPSEATLDAVRNVVMAPAASFDRWSLQVGRATEAIVTTPDGSRALVLAGDDAAIYVVDLVSRSIVNVLRFDDPIEGITVGADGGGYTMDRVSGQLLAFPID